MLSAAPVPGAVGDEVRVWERNVLAWCVEELGDLDRACSVWEVAVEGLPRWAAAGVSVEEARRLLRSACSRRSKTARAARRREVALDAAADRSPVAVDGGEPLDVLATRGLAVVRAAIAPMQVEPSTAVLVHQAVVVALLALQSSTSISRVDQLGSRTRRGVSLAIAGHLGVSERQRRDLTTLVAGRVGQRDGVLHAIAAVLLLPDGAAFVPSAQMRDLWVTRLVSLHCADYGQARSVRRAARQGRAGAA